MIFSNYFDLASHPLILFHDFKTSKALIISIPSLLRRSEISNLVLENRRLESANIAEILKISNIMWLRLE
jgi:hypothetical protein